MKNSTFVAQTPLQALMIEQALIMAKQLEKSAAEAPDGQVLKRAEALAVQSGRELTRKALEAVLQAQAQEAEKRGHPAEPAPAERGLAPKDTPRETS